MGIGSILGGASALLGYKSSKDQAKAQKAAMANASTELPLYMGFGAGGIGGGLGYNQPSQLLGFKDLIMRNPASLYTQGALQGGAGTPAVPGATSPAVPQAPAGTPTYQFDPYTGTYTDTHTSPDPTVRAGYVPPGASPASPEAAANPFANVLGFGMGDLDPSRTGLVGLAQGAIGRAGMAGTRMPRNVTAANQALRMLPMQTQDPNAAMLQYQMGGALGAQQLAGDYLSRVTGPGGYFNRIRMGLGESTLGALDEASMTGEQQRDRTLALLRQQAAPEEERAMNALQQRQFGTGQLGTTGGALQTEAFARGLGQADLSRQLAASEEGRAAQTQAMNRLQGFNQGFINQGNLSDSLLNNAFSRFGQTQDLLGGLGQRQYERSLTGGEQAWQRGRQNLQDQMALAQFVPQVQSAYLAPALQALQAQAGLQTQSIEPFQVALQLAQAQANARIGAGSNMAAIASNANFGAPTQYLSQLFAGIGERIGK